MMDFLDSQKMKGFIDGTLTLGHPDPEGMYEKWKKVDKQVMEWIMASLNYILKYMVEEMKTSKELWDTLEMFFTAGKSFIIFHKINKGFNLF